MTKLFNIGLAPNAFQSYVRDLSRSLKGAKMKL